MYLWDSLITTAKIIPLHNVYIQINLCMRIPKLNTPGGFLTLLPTRSQQETRTSPREHSQPKKHQFIVVRTTGHEGGERVKEHKVEKGVLCTTIQQYLGRFLLRGFCLLSFSVWEHGLTDAKIFHWSTSAYTASFQTANKLVNKDGSSSFWGAWFDPQRCSSCRGIQTGVFMPCWANYRLGISSSSWTKHFKRVLGSSRGRTDSGQ